MFVLINLFRKELILSGTLNPVKDLHLGKLALTKFPKSPETWIHRFVCLCFLRKHIEIQIIHIYVS